jgi:hypothetical protein
MSDQGEHRSTVALFAPRTVLALMFSIVAMPCSLALFKHADFMSIEEVLALSAISLCASAAYFLVSFDCFRWARQKTAAPALLRLVTLVVLLGAPTVASVLSQPLFSDMHGDTLWRRISAALGKGDNKKAFSLARQALQSGEEDVEAKEAMERLIGEYLRRQMKSALAGLKKLDELGLKGDVEQVSKQLEDYLPPGQAARRGEQFEALLVGGCVEQMDREIKRGAPRWARRYFQAALGLKPRSSWTAGELAVPIRTYLALVVELAKKKKSDKACEELEELEKLVPSEQWGKGVVGELMKELEAVAASKIEQGKYVSAYRMISNIQTCPGLPSSSKLGELEDRCLQEKGLQLNFRRGRDRVLINRALSEPFAPLPASYIPTFGKGPNWRYRIIVSSVNIRLGRTARYKKGNERRRAVHVSIVGTLKGRKPKTSKRLSSSHSQDPPERLECTKYRAEEICDDWYPSQFGMDSKTLEKAWAEFIQGAPND